MITLNSTDLCEGKYPRKNATLDYIILNNLVYKTCRSMVVDENREVTRISDHNLISMLEHSSDARKRARCYPWAEKTNLRLSVENLDVS